MIKTFSATINEIDDKKKALDDILSQLDIRAISRFRYSAGYITATEAFFETGFFFLLKSVLPFDIIGIETISCATDSISANDGEINLSLIVFVSDDVKMQAYSTEISEERYKSELAMLFAPILASNPIAPSLILTATSAISEDPIDDLVTAIDAATNSTLCFGSIGCSFTKSNASPFNARVIHNGKVLTKGSAFIVFFGKVNVFFESITIPKNKILQQDAIITSAKGVCIKKINNVVATRYFESLGFDMNAIIESLSLVPIIFQNPKRTRAVVRNIYRPTSEGTFVNMVGRAELGSKISLGSIDRNDILAGARKLRSKIDIFPTTAAALVFSCASRNLNLGFDNHAELDILTAPLGTGAENLIAYSGGEICPTRDVLTGKNVNSILNNSIAMCIIS